MRSNLVRYFLVVTLLATTLAGCGSSIQQSVEPALGKPALSAENSQAGNLALIISPAAREQVADNANFNPDALEAWVRRGLSSQNLLTAEPRADLPRIEVTITRVRARSGFSAMMFGFLAGADVIEGDVTVRGPDGQPLQNFRVSASYALGGLAGGQTSTRMEWLYDAFSKRVLEGVRGPTRSA